VHVSIVVGDHSLPILHTWPHFCLKAPAIFVVEWRHANRSRGGNGIRVKFAGITVVFANASINNEIADVNSFGPQAD
jgi:hypothetical protein